MCNVSVVKRISTQLFETHVTLNTCSTVVCAAVGLNNIVNLSGQVLRSDALLRSKLGARFSEDVVRRRKEKSPTYILLSGLSCRCMARENPNRLPGSPCFLITLWTSRLNASAPGSCNQKLVNAT